MTESGVLSRGLISGHWTKDSAGKGDFRAMSPRFQGKNVEHNLALVEALRQASVMRLRRWRIWTARMAVMGTRGKPRYLCLR